METIQENTSAPQHVSKLTKAILCTVFFGYFGVPAIVFSAWANSCANQGDMELRFENLSGKTSVKVYDMRGTLIDVIDTYNNLYSNTLHYSLKPIPSGIYYFVATAKEGTIAKKVIIE